MAVIKFTNVSKHFIIYKNKVYSLKERFMNTLLNRNKLEMKQVNVLKNASFEILKGQTVGIIGENGTGKSTTLKLISKILIPNEGEIEVKGKISSLLEIGIGFQPDMTGKENVYLYGSILGLSRQAISKKYEEIVEFAELKDFMDTPVKNYSSGMYMRLAFSVAVSVEPDILLVDEVLAVGDANFQKKCIDKILSFKNEGKTIVFVSHDMSTVRKICERVLFIKRGGFVIEGTPEQMIGLYLKLVYSNDEGKEILNQSIEQRKKVELESNFKLDMHEAKEFSNINREGNMDLEITKLYFSDFEGRIRNAFYPGEDIKINVEFRKNKNVKSTVFAIKVYTEEGWYISYHDCKQDGIIITNLKDSTMFSLIIKNNIFLKSKYFLTAALLDEDCNIKYDVREKNYLFHIVESNITQQGKISLKCDWQI